MKHIIMNYKPLILVILTFFIASAPNFLCAQKPMQKTAQLKKLFKPNPKPDYKKYLKNSTNEFEGTAALLFVGYKSFLSSQDMSSCVFTPSCSVYAIETLKRNPIHTAYLKIFDRLSRCHPLSTKHEYEFHPKTGMLYDPAY
ncbi:MAG TPA: membrane protein insertion efficiency factor YidD [Prolixibacteraceae bacterium]|nr:membrane protein insertion efficiency factor YidD [Prolixibacteraceae bacterium]